MKYDAIIILGIVQLVIVYIAGTVMYGFNWISTIVGVSTVGFFTWIEAREWKKTKKKYVMKTIH